MASILKYATLVTVLTGLSSALGALRGILLVNKLDVGVATDSFFAASGIIESLIVLSGLNAMKSVATTTFTKARSNSADTSSYLSALLYGTLVYGLLVGLPALFAPKLLMKLLVPGFSGEHVTMTGYCLQIMSLLVLFKSLSLILGSLLGVRHKFFMQNIFTSVMNVVALVTIVVSSQERLIYNLSAAIVLSFAFACLVQYLAVSSPSSRLVFIPFSVIQRHVVEFAKLAYPLLFVTAAFSLASMVDKIIGSFFHSGVITSLGIAYTLCFRGIAIVLNPMASVYFPHFSRLYFEKKHDELARDFNKGQLVSGLFLVPVGVFIAFFAHEIVSAIYLADKITASDIKTTADILAVYGVALILHSMYFLPAYLFQGAQKNMVVGKVGIIVYVTNIVCSVTFSYLWGYIGIPMGTVVAFLVYGWLLIGGAKKHFRISQSKRVWIILGVVLGISIVSAILVKQVPDLGRLLSIIPQTFASIAQCVALFGMYATVFLALTGAAMGRRLYRILGPIKSAG